MTAQCRLFAKTVQPNPSYPSPGSMPIEEKANHTSRPPLPPSFQTHPTATSNIISSRRAKPPRQPPSNLTLSHCLTFPIPISSPPSPSAYPLISILPPRPPYPTSSPLTVPALRNAQAHSTPLLLLSLLLLSSSSQTKHPSNPRPKTHHPHSAFYAHVREQDRKRRTYILGTCDQGEKPQPTWPTPRLVAHLKSCTKRLFCLWKNVKRIRGFYIHTTKV